jgi:hypothetical protein
MVGGSLRILWFLPPVTTKTGLHDIVEILLSGIKHNKIKSKLNDLGLQYAGGVATLI